MKQDPFSVHLSRGVLTPPPTWTIIDSRWDAASGRVPVTPHLFGVVPCETELARCLAPSVFAAVEVHAPGTTEGEGGTAGVGVFALASTGPAATHIPSEAQIHYFLF